MTRSPRELYNFAYSYTIGQYSYFSASLRLSSKIICLRKKKSHLSQTVIFKLQGAYILRYTQQEILLVFIL